MKGLLTVGLILMLAATAFAGGNPYVYAYISFDAAGDLGSNAVTPAPYTTVNAYVCLGCIEEGMTTISFLMNDVMVQCPGVMATQSFVNLLPGNLGIGNAFVAPGITLASTECMTVNPVVVGYVTCFYLGGDCCFQLLDHVDYPRWVVDCAEPGQVDYYCLQGHGTVGAAQCPPGEDCNLQCMVPVEDSSWGGIKAMYR